MKTLKDFHPAREMPETLVRVPTFIQGALADAFLPEYERVRKGNDSFAFSQKRGENGELRGANVFSAGLTNKVLADAETGFRVIVPTDAVYKEIYPMIKDNFYTEFNALDIWEIRPEDKANLQIWEQAVALAESTQGKANFPFRIQGVYCLPDKRKEGYQARIIPAPNFRVIEDKKLSLPTGTKFNSLDENGMIVPDARGKFTKYTLGKGVSGVFLNSDGGFGSNSGNLGSGGYGRVVAVDAEGEQK